MVQLELHADAGVAQSGELSAVARELRFIELLLARLHARPVDPHAVRLDAERAQKGDILLPVLRVLCGDGGRGLVADMAEPPPVDPAALQLAALALERGGAKPGQHVLFERETVHGRISFVV